MTFSLPIFVTFRLVDMLFTNALVKVVVAHDAAADIVAPAPAPAQAAENDDDDHRRCCMHNFLALICS